jgi:hypothetical protein
MKKLVFLITMASVGVSLTPAMEPIYSAPAIAITFVKQIQALSKQVSDLRDRLYAIMSHKGHLSPQNYKVFTDAVAQIEQQVANINTEASAFFFGQTDAMKKEISWLPGIIENNLTYIAQQIDKIKSILKANYPETE